MQKIKEKGCREAAEFAAAFGISFLALGLLRVFWKDVGLKLLLEYGAVSAGFAGLAALALIWKKKRWAVDLSALFFGAWFMFFTGERLISGTEIEWYLLPYWVNILLVAGICLLVYSITGSVRTALWGTDALIVFFMISNAFLKQARGHGLDVIDAYSVGTAMKVAGNYHFQVTRVMAAGIGINLMMLCFLCRWYQKTAKECSAAMKAAGMQEAEPVSETPEGQHDIRRWGKGWICRLSCCVLPLFLIWSIPFSSFWSSRNYVASYSSDRNGMLFNLLLEVPDLIFMPPEGYSPETAEALLSGYDNERERKEVTEYPNIIVIMNESLADFSLFRELETDAAVLPFLSTLEDNTIKGYSYASIYGGNTATSEYEFLTGDSNILYHTMPYSTMIQGDEAVMGLPAQLRSIGYRTIAVHPYSNSAYRRSIVYPSLGFEEMYFQEDLDGLYPVRNGLYASDMSNYEEILKLLKEKESDERFFLFDVTMQNHAPYQDIEKTVRFQGTDAYDEVEQYLTLANESDQAFSEFLYELEQYGESVIVLMFGDHQPSFETEFDSYLFGKTKEEMTSEERMQRYAVPFYLWANYDIEEEDGIWTSMNYLSLLVLEEAGIPLSAYQCWLKELQEEYPVISCSGIIDSEGNRYPQNEKESLTPEYLQLIYYHMCGEADGGQELFGYGETTGN